MGRTPRTWAVGGRRDSLTLQGTCAPLRPWRPINPCHVLEPRGDGLFLARGRRRHVAKEVAALRPGARFTPMGEEARVAETDQAGREDRQQDAAAERRRVHGPLLQRVAAPPVARGAADGAIAAIDQARVRDGAAMRGAAERVDARGGSCTGGVGIHAPRRGGEVDLAT